MSKKMRTQTEIYEFNYNDPYGDRTVLHETGRVWYGLSAGGKYTTFYVDVDWPRGCDVDCQSSSKDNKRKFINALRRITGSAGYRYHGNYYDSGLSVCGKYSLERI